MNTISLKKINTKATAAFSQTAFLGKDDSQRFGEQIRVNPRSAQIVLTRTLVADSVATSIEYMNGMLIADNWVTLVRNTMATHGLTAKVVYDSLVAFLLPFCGKTSLWTSCIARSLGLSNVALIDIKKVAPVSPSDVRSAVGKIYGIDEALEDTDKALRPLFVTLLSEIVTSKLAHLGMVTDDAAVRLDFTPEDSIVGLAEMVDYLYLARIQRLIEAISSATVDLAEAMVKRGEAEVKLQGISIPALAGALASACHRAYVRLEHHYDPTSVVYSIVSAVHDEIDPEAPDAVRIPRALASTVRMEEYTSNLSFIYAVGEFTKLTAEEVKCVSHDEQTLRHYFDEFADSMGALSFVRTVPLEDIAGRFGLEYTYDYTGRPVRGVLYEAWAQNSRAVSFTPVKHIMHKFRYLMADPVESMTLSDALGVIGSAIHIGKTIDNRLTLHARMDEATRYSEATKGAQLDVAVMSSLVSEYERDISADNLSDLLAIMANDCKKDGLTLKSIDEDQIAGLERRAKRINRSIQYAVIACAVVNARRLSLEIARVTDQEESRYPRLALIWSINTNFALALGNSAIFNGEVRTTEPLEALLYSPEVRPTRVLDCVNHDIASMAHIERAQVLHAWEWWKIANDLNVETEYRTSLQGNSYTVSLDHGDFLGTPTRAKPNKFFIPASLRAIVRTWYEWYEADYSSAKNTATLTAQDKGDDRYLASQAFLRNLEGVMVDTLRRIGNSPMAKTINKKVIAEMTSALYASGAIDSRPDLLIGAQAMQRELWVGILILQFLTLITDKEARSLIERLSRSEALVSRIGSVYADLK